MNRAVLCDLDGTLVDTAADLAAALNALLGEIGYAPLAHRRIRRFIGGGAVGIVRGGLAAAGVTVPDAVRFDRLVRRFLEIYEAAPAANSRPYGGVVVGLDALAADGWHLAVCTNKPQAPADRILQDLDLAPRFTAVVGGDAVPAKKPDAGHVHAVLDRLSVPPAGAVLVGDSRTDLDAARNAGIAVVLVTYGYTEMPVTAMGADAVVGSFTALSAVLNRLDAGAQPLGQRQELLVR